MYAVIATGGKQYRVQKDDVIDIERLEGEVGAKVTFDEVLLVGEGTGIECGTPLLKSAKVTAEIVDQFRGKKLTVFKMKRRKGYRKKHGHRQELTKVKITDISAGSKAKKAAPAKEEAKAEKVTAE
jgi:large subunit ribosomal protein L21